MLSSAVPLEALVNPGSSNITHEPASSSFTLMFSDGLSVVTLYSVPARTLVSPSAVNCLPLRLRTTGGPDGAGVPLIRPPPGAMAKTTGVAAAALGAPAPGPAAPAPPGAAARAAAAPGPPAPGAPPPKPPNPTAPPPPPTVKIGRAHV